MRLRTLIGVTYLAVQVIVPLARMSADRPLLTSGKFSWSMYSGRTLIRCERQITYRSRSTGEILALPLPRSGPLREAFGSNDMRWGWAPTMYYADDLREIVNTVHGVTRAYKATIDPRNENEISDAVKCTWDGLQAPYVETLTL